MQTKIFCSFIALFITIVVSAQQPLYTATINDNRVPEKESSFLFSVVAVKAAVLNVSAYNPEKKKIQVQINHQVLGLLADTSFTSEQFNCRYNFDEVEDGRYQVTLISGKEKVTKEIEINTVTRRNLSIL